jgi:hypothetical protein
MWQIRLADVKKSLDANNFQAFVVENASEAKDLVLKEIIPEIAPRSISWGGSMTFVATGLYDELKNAKTTKVIDTFDKTISREDGWERRRPALLVDLFITGTNAVTESGTLVNLDMLGNRVAAIAFGPLCVVILVGRSKIVGKEQDRCRSGRRNDEDQVLRCPGKRHASGNEDTMCEDLLLRRLQEQRTALQQLGDHGKILPEGQGKGNPYK